MGRIPDGGPARQDHLEPRRSPLPDRGYNGVAQFHGYRPSRQQGSRRRLVLGQVSGVGVSANAVVYSGILNEDVDGAPNCYGRFPFDAGIDRLKYATNLVGGGMFNELPKGQLAHPWMWRGVANMTHQQAVDTGPS